MTFVKNTWPGWEYEREWVLCVDCETRRPRRSLSPAGHCLDRPWCFKAQQERAARRAAAPRALPASTAPVPGEGEGKPPVR